LLHPFFFADFLHYNSAVFVGWAQLYPGARTEDVLDPTSNKNCTVVKRKKMAQKCR